MKAIVSVLALALTVVFVAPAFAASKTPTTQAACEKAKMTWDATAKKCEKGKM
jgi:hypothetical protein